MSVIKLAISLLCLASAISAIRGPKVIYSALIQNAQPGEIHCSVTWSKPSGNELESNLFTVGEKQQYLASEKKMQMGTWEARAIIKEIRCGDLVVTAPFDKVTSPRTNWEFLVQSDKIISVGPSA